MARTAVRRRSPGDGESGEEGPGASTRAVKGCTRKRKRTRHPGRAGSPCVSGKQPACVWTARPRRWDHPRRRDEQCPRPRLRSLVEDHPSAGRKHYDWQLVLGKVMGKAKGPTPRMPGAEEEANGKRHRVGAIFVRAGSSRPTAFELADVEGPAPQEQGTTAAGVVISRLRHGKPRPPPLTTPRNHPHAGQEQPIPGDPTHKTWGPSPR